MSKGISLAIASLLVPAMLSAQASPAPKRNVISIQPLSAVFTVLSGEYERAMSKSVTWGVGATHWDAGDGIDKVNYSSGDLKLRFYPSGAALYGFSFGMSLGMSSVKGQNTSGAEQTVTGGAFGVLLEYQWLLGEQRNFALALGAGAKALFVNENDLASSDFTARYPTARVSVGYAF